MHILIHQSSYDTCHGTNYESFILWFDFHLLSLRHFKAYLVSSLFHTHSPLQHFSERHVEIGTNISRATCFFSVKLSSCLSLLRGVCASVSNYAPCSSFHREILRQAILWTDILHAHIALGTHLTQFVWVVILYSYWSVKTVCPHSGLESLQHFF